MLILGLLCAVVAAIGLAYLVLAIVAVVRLREPPVASRRCAKAVTLLKPLHGAAPTLYDDLRTFLIQDYAGPVQIVFGLQNAADPAAAIVERLRSAHPDADIRLVVDATLHGPNRKVSNLVNMTRVATGDVMVLSDDDLRVGPDYLNRILSALSGEGVGAVTCLYHGVSTGSASSALARLGIDTHFLPGVLVGLMTGLARPCFGSTIALRAETLRRIGGFEAVIGDLADDYEIGRRVRDLGLLVSVPSFTIGHVFSERTLRQLVRQELRWARTIRAIDPAGHAGSLLCHPLPFALLACLAWPGGVSLATLGLALSLRWLLCLAVERRFGLRPHPYWIIPARDLLSFGLLVASFAGRRVSWRGESYGVSPVGALQPSSER